MRIVRFALGTVAFCVLAMLFIAYGNNVGINGDFDWNTFWDSFFGVFGGIWSFLAILGALAFVAIAFLVLRAIGSRNRDLAYGVAAVSLLVALIVGAAFVRVDLAIFGGFWPFMGFLLFAAISTAIIGWILGAVPLRRRTTTTSPTTTTTTTD